MITRLQAGKICLGKNMNSPSPYYEKGLITVYVGEALQILQTLPDGMVDVVLTDPPYSSGGMVRGDRAGQSCRAKYQTSSTQKSYWEFSGDNRDQRGFLSWCVLWLEELRRVTKPGAVCGLFTDWRQLPTITDALQVGGWVWRGIVPWDKTEAARPQKGRWRAQCEYVVWGTNGPAANEGPCLPGFYRGSVFREEKRHMTEKPVWLMQELCKIAHSDDAVILDPFMGSGSTLKGAAGLKRRAIGIEINKEIADVAVQRISEPTQFNLFV